MIKLYSNVKGKSKSVDIINFLLQLNQNKGSDLLLAADNPPTMHVNNMFYKLSERNLTAEEVEALITPIIRKEELEELKQTRELDTSYQDEISRYRINLHYQRGSIGATIRRIPREIPSLEQLKLPTAVKTFTTLVRGLVLVTGPTGCGKSTTQAAMIDSINNSKAAHIVTVEDPIEFVHTSKLAFIEQREVGIDTNSFSEALKRSLRQIPDVVLVGEMRDLESIQMAVTAAETGHLVISTLHTQDAVQSIDRIIDAFPPHHQPQIRTQLSLTLQGIICQQLITRKDGKGLIGAFEILIATPAVRNIIRKGATQDIYSMIELGSQFGMQSMDYSLQQLYQNNIICRDDALNFAISRERMEKMLSASA